MARNRTATGQGRPRSEATRQRIVEATAASIRELGFGGTTTATIAAGSGLTEGAIFYHFGSIVALFSEVLRRSSEERLTAYRAALHDVDRPDEVLARAVALFAEDQATGHVAVLAELFAGAGSVEGLRPLVHDQVTAWVAFVEEVLGRILSGSGLEGLLPEAGDLAKVIVSLYTGAELLGTLAPDLGVTESLTAVVVRAGPLLAAFGPPQGAP